MIKKCFLLVGIFLNMVFAAGCGQLLNASVGMEVKQEADAAPQDIEMLYEITDIDREESSAGAVEIQLADVKEGLIISEGGNYILSGSNDNCNIVVNVYDDEIVHLFLKDVELSAQAGPVILIQKAGKAIITVVDGSENTISDSADYATETEACIFSNSDLSINGSGQLSVYGYYHDAIRSKDRLKLIGINLYVRAKNDGLRGNDGVVVENSNVEIESEGTGILTNSEQGYVVIQGGKCKVTSGENAIAADIYAAVRDCDSDLYSVSEAVKCSGIKEIEEDN